MASYNPSCDLWALLYDLDNAIDSKAIENGGIASDDPLMLQRRQVRILLQLHAPDEVPDFWSE